MKYFSSEEIRNTEKENISKVLKSHIGRNLENFFAANLTAKYHDLSFSNRRPSSKILDCGIGNGEFANQLYKIGFLNMHGVDIDNYLTEENSKLIKEFKEADFNCEKIPWPDDYFEIVTAWCVLPHLENPHFFVREIFRILKPGGLFILSIPHILSKASKNYFNKKGDFPRYLSSTNHITVFTRGSFENLMRNFKTVNMEYMIDSRIFQGKKGLIRKTVFNLLCLSSITKGYIEKLWGYNQIWVLSKETKQV